MIKNHSTMSFLIVCLLIKDGQSSSRRLGLLTKGWLVIFKKLQVAYCLPRGVDDANAFKENGR